MQKVLLWILAIVVVFGLVSCASSSSSSNSNERDVEECSSCGKKYYAGDQGGNYSKIVWTSMCKKCYENYKWAQEVKDYYELNY